jgi:hypothetical protein
MQRNLYIASIICVLILFIDSSLTQFKRICEKTYLTTSSRRKTCRLVENALTKNFKKVLLVRLKTKFQ